MDVVALVSVISSALVALSTVAANVWLRRGDRRHELKLDYERRVWEDKSTALAMVMARCNALRASCEASRRDVTAGAPIATMIQRVIVIQAMDQVRFSGDDARLIAYAAPEVRKLVKQLDVIVSRELSPMGDLVDMERAIAEGREPERSGVTLQELARSSTLDIGEVEQLCTEIVEAARKDLRGRHR